MRWVNLKKKTCSSAPAQKKKNYPVTCKSLVCITYVSCFLTFMCEMFSQFFF